jgi:hypothetical protein
VLDQRVAAGGLRDWAPRAFAEFARRRPLHVIGTRGYPWTEIDFPEDYERAINEVLPAIEADVTLRVEPDTTVRVRSVRLRPGASGSALLPAAGE